MKLRRGFNDVSIVNGNGGIEYINVKYPDFFGYRPEELIGKKFTQVYTNIDEESSTFMRAINYGDRFVNYVQTLTLADGKVINQTEDIYVLKNGKETVGAVEFCWYDEKTDILREKSAADLTAKEEKMPSLDDIVGECPAIRELKRKVAKIRDKDSSILIMGETGTGKELTARTIHYASNRRQHPFIYISCSALPESLLEGILFGIKKGSFTDAEEKDGLFKLADRGTLFLDELDSMPMGIQAKILKAIEEKAIRPIGGSEDIYLDVRIIASCNTDVQHLMSSGKIRADLFFRLSVIQLALPPLRERGEDVLRIAAYYIDQFNQTSLKAVSGFSPQAKTLLLSHRWPGNVREVKNMLEGFFSASNKTVIDVEDIRAHFVDAPEQAQHDRAENEALLSDFAASSCGLKEYLQAKEDALAREALEAAEGNVSRAAALLKISPQLLRYKMKKMKE